MKRRDTIKTLLIGGVAGSTMGQLSCNDTSGEETLEASSEKLYGRTPAEIEHDAQVNAEVFLTEHELTTIAVLCDIILPPTDDAGSATDAGVPEFIEFMVKDLPVYQLPIRGGLMWLDSESNFRFKKSFNDCSNEEQLSIVDDIAYPDPENLKPAMTPGRLFFNRMRNFTLTGYYTTKMGIDDLGYVGNRPNMWDGVPQDVLDKHGLAYDEEWMSKFVDHTKSNIQAEWDENGNLIN